MFHEVAPAMPFFLPRGAYVYNALVDYMRELYERDGYEEVITPQVFDPQLFETSGHLGQLQREHVPPLDGGPAREAPGRGGSSSRGLQADAFALKPMNCPSHCLIFGHASGAATASSRGAWPTSAACTATSAAASSTAWRACAASARTTRTSSAPRTQVAARDRELHPASSTRSTGASTSTKIDIKLATPPREAHRHRRAVGRGREARSPQALERAEPAVRDLAGRGRVLRPEDRVPRAGRAQAQLAARHDPVRLRTCPSASTSSTSGEDGNDAPAGHAPPRDLRLARALLRRSTSSTAAGASRRGSRPSRRSSSP